MKAQATKNPLDEAKAEYQAAVGFEVAKAEYQQSLAKEFSQVLAPAPAAVAEMPAKKKKVRVRHPEAQGKSPNNFEMKCDTGQIDKAAVEGKAATGRWPSAKDIAAKTGIPEKRVAEHIAWWQKHRHAGKGPLYL